MAMTNQINPTYKFMFFSNFLDAIDQLSDIQLRYKACYEFCKYGITGELPSDEMIRMFCLGVEASVHKYQGRGGARKGAGRPKSEENQIDTDNQNIQKNQKNQNNQNAQTETETKTGTKRESKEKESGSVIQFPEPTSLSSATASNQEELFGGDCSSFADKKSSNKNLRFGEGQRVWLTEEQYNTLNAKYEDLDKAIEKMDTWLETSATGRKNKNRNHYWYFKKDSWVWGDNGATAKKIRRPQDVDELPQMDGTRVWYDYRENKVLDIPFVPNHEPDWSRWDDVARKMK